MSEYAYLTFDQRREIERMHNAGARTADIAKYIGKSNTAVYVDLQRGYTGELGDDMRPVYSARQAQEVFQRNISRRGKRIEKKMNKIRSATK